MLFMNVMSWEPDKRDALIKRWAEKAENGTLIPQGSKHIGAWVGGERIFTLFEVDDNESLQRERHAWCDLANIESIPVMKLEAKMKISAGK
jgi:muconolactone delta-isomerase